MSAGDFRSIVVACRNMTSVIAPAPVGGARRHGRGAAAAAVAAAALALVAHLYFLGFLTHFGLFGNGVDAVVYRHGGSTVLSGEDLYTFSLFDTNLPFTYPPFAALAFVGLALLPVAATIVVVDVVNVVLLYVAVLLSWRLLGYRGGNTHVVSICLAIAASWLEPVRMTLWLGQINLLLLVLVLWDLGRPEGSRLRGVGVGLAAGFKLTPAFFIVYAVALRQWRTAVVAAATFAGTVLLGFVVLFEQAWSYWTSALFNSDRIGLLQSPANQSVRGMLARAWPDGSPPLLVWVIGSLAVACLGMWAAVLAHRRGARLLSLTLCGLTTPMVSPFSWGHHWVGCVPLTVLALDQACRASWRWRWVRPVVVIAPFIAWYWTAPEGFAVIGTFMLPKPGVIGLLCSNAYPLAFVMVLAGVVAAAIRARSLRGDGLPRLQLLFERHRRVRRARRRQTHESEGSLPKRRHVPRETALGLGAVEEDAVDGRVRVEELRKVVGLDGRFDDCGIQTPVPGAQLQHVPHGDPVV